MGQLRNPLRDREKGIIDKLFSFTAVPDIATKLGRGQRIIYEYLGATGKKAFRSAKGSKKIKKGKYFNASARENWIV